MGEIFAKNLQFYLEINGMKQSTLSKKTGITKGAINSYLKGDYEPKSKNLHLIASVLSVREKRLLGLEEKEDRIITNKEEQLLQLFSLLNNNGQNEAIKNIKLLAYVPYYKKEGKKNG